MLNIAIKFKLKGNISVFIYKTTDFMDLFPEKRIAGIADAANL